MNVWIWGPVWYGIAIQYTWYKECNNPRTQVYFTSPITTIQNRQVRNNTLPNGGIVQSKKVMLTFKGLMEDVMVNAFAPETIARMACTQEFVGLRSTGTESSEEFDVMQAHLDFLLKYLKHINRFHEYHWCTPFCCNAFLDLNTATDHALAEQVLQKMKNEWTFIISEEQKCSKWLSDIHFARWQVFREVHTCAEENGYKLCDSLLRLVKAYLPGRQNTVGLEHTFGSLRDAESRHSKHKQASGAQVSANAIRATNKLFGESNTIVETHPSMIAQVPSAFSQGVLKKDCFNPCKTALGECGIRNASELIKLADNRSNAFNFMQKGVSQLRARQLAFELKWAKTDYLWVAGIIPEGSVSSIWI